MTVVMIRAHERFIWRISIPITNRFQGSGLSCRVRREDRDGGKHGFRCRGLHDAGVYVVRASEDVSERAWSHVRRKEPGRRFTCDGRADRARRENASGGARRRRDNLRIRSGAAARRAGSGGGRMSELYRVREFAALAGVTVKALHHYDRVGLLEPRRTRAGYRLYSRSDRDRLEQIRALKFVGLPLRQIKTLLGRRSPSMVQALTRQRRELDEQRTRLDRAIASIDWELAEAERATRSAGITRAPDRFNDARVLLYRDIAAAIEAGAVDDLNGVRAQELLARWRAIMEDEMSNADDAVRAKIEEVFAG